MRNLLCLAYWLSFLHHIYAVSSVNPTPTLPVAGFPYGPATVITDPIFKYQDGFVQKGETRRDGTVDGNIENRQFKLTAKDGLGAAMGTGGALFVVEMFTSNPICDTKAVSSQCKVICTPWKAPHTRSPSCLSSPHVETTQFKLNPSDLKLVTCPEWSVGVMNDVGGGVYVGTYFPERKDHYDVSIMLAEQGGLFGKYYDNTWFLNAPSVARVDPTINFNWGTGPITQFGSDYVSIRWYGKIRPDYSEPFTFYITVLSGARLWIDRQLIIDVWGGATNETSAKVLLEKDFLHDIILEYNAQVGVSLISMSWSSFTLPKQIVSSQNLYSLSHISGSPFLNVSLMAGDPPYNDTTVAWGPGLGPRFPTPSGQIATNVVGVNQTFTYQAFDVFNNVQDGLSVLANWTFTVDGADSNPSLANITYDRGLDNSTYNVVYNVLVSGYYNLSLKTNGKHISGSPWTVYVSPAKTYSPKSIMWGPGLSDAVVASTTYITIRAKDIYNNNRSMCSDYVQLFFTGPPGAYVKYGVDATRNDGLYYVDFTPQNAGSYVVNVKLNNVDIIGSPFNLVIRPAVSSGLNSIVVSDTDAMHNATSMVESTITLYAKDIFSNQILIGGCVITGNGLLISPSSPLVDVGRWQPMVLMPTVQFNITFTDHSNGIYTIKYTALYAGNYSFSILINGQHVLGSPFPLIIYPYTVFPASTVVTGTGLSLGYADQMYTIYVRARDAFLNNLLDFQIGSKLNTFSVNLQCTLNGATTTVTPFNTTFVGSSTFLFQYVPTLASPDCVVNVKAVAANVHVPGSPFAVIIQPAAPYFPLCTLAGSGLYSTIAGIPASFLLTANDKYNNLVRAGGIPFFYNVSARFTDVTNFDVKSTTASLSWIDFTSAIPIYWSSAIDLGTGVYQSDYQINKAGNFSLNVYMRSPGGLRAAYYAAPDFTAYYGWRIDSAVDFDWGYGTPFDKLGLPNNVMSSDAFPADRFSVIWSGQLLAVSSELTRFYIDSSSNVGVQLWISGHVIINSSSVLLGQEAPFGDLTLTAQQMYDIFVYCRADVGNASISLSWSTLTRPKEVINSTLLHHIDALGASPYPLVISPAPITAKQSVLLTHPLPVFIAGIPCILTVQARDLYSNDMWNSSTQVASRFAATFTSIPTAQPLQIALTPMEKGVYNITFTPFADGPQVLNIMYDSTSIGGLPLTVQVQAGMTVASTTTLVTQFTNAVTSSSTAPPLTSSIYNATAGTWNTFIIQARDINSNTRKVGGDELTVLLIGQSGSNAAGVNCSGIVGDLLNGAYNVSYRCPVAGQYSFQIFLNNTQPVANTPYLFTVYPAIPYPMNTVFTNGVPSNVTSNAPFVYSITAFDTFNNSHVAGGNHFIVKCTDNYGTWVRGLVTDLNTGVYSVSTILPIAGSQWQCFVLVVDGVSNRLNGLVGTYFDNRWQQNTPVMTRVDPIIDFNWVHDKLTPDSASYVGITWKGFVQPASAGTFTIYCTADDAARVYIDNILVVDAWRQTSYVERWGNFTFPVAGMLYDIHIQYKQSVGAALISLKWSSDLVTKQVIPPSALYTSATNIYGSPFLIQTD